MTSSTPTITSNAPIKNVSPCEGTGFEIGSMSIIKGAPNLENAKKWYDWALTPDAQKLAARPTATKIRPTRMRRFPSRRRRWPTSSSSSMTSRSIGSSAERKRLLGRWDKEIGAK